MNEEISKESAGGIFRAIAPGVLKKKIRKVSQGTVERFFKQKNQNI